MFCAVSDADDILRLIIERAEARLESQLRDYDALDVKALGILAADAAAIGVLIATHDSSDACGTSCLDRMERAADEQERAAAHKLRRGSRWSSRVGSGGSCPLNRC